jgi:cobyrinic acid a,c-diamide synthase
MSHRQCPALLLTAPASGQGKTTLTAGLARHHRNQGRKVRVFKVGPDYLDPMILAQASGSPVYQLDLWMVGEKACRALLHEAAAEADLILVEGVMGLFDGTPSSADLAEALNLPVLAFIDAVAMAQTFGAIAHGLATYRDSLCFHGVLANRVGHQGHADLLAEGLPEDLRFLGYLPQHEDYALPNRHLGLVQATEVLDLEARINAAAHALANSAAAELPAAVDFDPAPGLAAPDRLLANKRIAVARDAAFSFIYPANLDVLKQMGAELAFFSPLVDPGLPEADSVFLPGGYPELHLQTLAANHALIADLKRHVRNGKPIYAECGGLLYLLDSLTDKQGVREQMAGLLPGAGIMQPRLAALGMQSLCAGDREARGHTFHHSKIETPLQPWVQARHQRQGRTGEAVYRHGPITASYLHLYFPSCASLAADLLLGRL